MPHITRVTSAGLVVVLGLLTVLSPTSRVAAQAEPPPDYLSWADPGPYLAPGTSDFSVDSFSSSQPIVGTYFFYWFDANTIRDHPENFAFNPVDDQTQSFLDPAWYQRQFSDMLDAGIDFALPDYWGEPGQYNRRVAPAPDRNLFATQGIPPMVQALQQLDAAGRPFKIGMFFDTSILNNEDLTTDRGKQIFYTTIRDYFSRIPPRYWAAIDGQPIVWLYDAQHVSAFDQSTFDYVYQQFASDFGGLRPWIVREEQWYTSRSNAEPAVLQTEGVYAWGAAPFGFDPDPRLTVAAVGPGFTASDEGPDTPDTPRNDGAYYQSNWQQALASGRKVAVVETWNELDEGTGILDTHEFGRQYIDLTRRYADLFKAGQSS